jgi:hypothetical protein
MRELRRKCPNMYIFLFLLLLHRPDERRFASEVTIVFLLDGFAVPDT